MKQRIELLDLWRSLCVFVMVAFHLCYDLMLFGRIPAAAMTSAAAKLITWVFGGSFVFISGSCLHFSRDPLRRGFFVFCVGGAVTAVTALLGMPVAFGILQLLGVCMMLCGALRERMMRSIGAPFVAANALLFGVTWFLTARVRVPWKLLYPLGLRSAGFFSADYWPVFPWIFLFLLGMAFGRLLEQKRAHPLLQKHFSPALTFAGRHSLIIYLVHQPILYGICWLIFR